MSRPAQNEEAMPILNCQVTDVAAESFRLPVLNVSLTPKHATRLTSFSDIAARDKALKIVLPSITGKLSPLMLYMGTYTCTRIH